MFSNNHITTITSKAATLTTTKISSYQRIGEGLKHLSYIEGLNNDGFFAPHAERKTQVIMNSLRLSRPGPSGPAVLLGRGP